MSQKFLQARKEHQAAIAKAISSQQEDDEENEDGGEDYSPALGKLVKGYSKNDEDIGRQIADFMASGLAACLVCIEEVKKNEAIWCCSNCYGIFHLVCIQRWIREGVYQRISASFDAVTPPPESLPWNCPKCRYEYSAKMAPTAYLCYCRKTKDPEPDLWLLPHSCGQVCGRQLKPVCAHTCLLLCHPGPCPPCPAFVHTTCFCGKSPPTPRRCVDREWSCSRICGKKLSCGRHTCPVTCHSGPCEKCPAKITRPCRCRRKTAERPCSEGEWLCQQPCGKKLSCERHFCKENCHPPGPCPPCPLTLTRRCPCGKTSISGLSCDIETSPACFETCDKLLACGIHRCYQRCHVGSCGDCKEMVRTKCRCGAKQPMVMCYLATAGEVTCEIKCQKMRDCGRHPCRKRCCIDCPSCDHQCNRPLACGKHKCQSRCHRGRCYPCTEIVKLGCNCGETVLRVPCGSKNVKRPRCSLLCQRPSNCRHDVVPHRCHFEDCPQCRKACGAALPCGHSCVTTCHDWVLVQEKDEAKEAELRAQPQGPWMLNQVDIRYVRKTLPCPPCGHPVDVTCLGGHETTTMPCSTAKSQSCHRKCGKLLSCGHHVCEQPCHSSKRKCDECLSGCEQPRPSGCSHGCVIGLCHREKCPPCKRVVGKRCHCEQMMLAIECFKLTAVGGEDEQKNSRLLSCGNRCAKNMPCGHRCFDKCHPGPCKQVPSCAEMISRRCACRRIRLTEECQGRFIHDTKVPLLPCDSECRRRADAAKAAKAKAEEEKKKEASVVADQAVNGTSGEVRQRKRRQRNRDFDEEEDEGLMTKLCNIVSLKQLVVLTFFAILFGGIAFILVNY